MSEAESVDKILYDAPDFRVRYNGGGSSSICFVTFDSVTDTPDLARPAFAEIFLREQGIDAVHVINRTNVWYAYKEFEAALEKIRATVKRYDRVFTYGSSMGGYTAIRCAQAVGARTAIAISPQYSVSRRLAPFEYRWRSLTDKLDRIQDEPRHGSQSVSPIVFYDPVDLDALHFDLIAQNYPRTVGVPMHYAGHPAGAMLSETGLLSKTILSIVDDTFDHLAVARELRSRRRLSGQYLFTLARRLNPRRARVKNALASAAVRTNRDAAYLVYAGLVAEWSGDAEACDARLNEALAILCDHPFVLRAISAFSIRHGRAASAVEFATRLCAVDPQPHYKRLQTVAFAIAGRLAEARATAPRYRTDPLFRFSLARPVVGSMPRRLLVWWWARAYRIEAEFALVDGWRDRKKMWRRQTRR